MNNPEERRSCDCSRMKFGRFDRVPPAIACLAALVLVSAPAAAQKAAPPLFPRPFMVEHGIVETEADGTTFRTPAVTDYYGGSWIVSVRPDRSRVVIDFGKREITEVRTKDGTYTVLSFARLAELRDRLRRAEQPVVTKAASGASKAGAADRAKGPPKLSFAFEELPVADASTPEPKGPQNSAPRQAAGRVLRHVRVTAQSESGETPKTGTTTPAATMDVWLDSTVRLEPAALAALASLENGVINPGSTGERAGAGELLAAAREHAGGAFPVRTSRALSKVDGKVPAARIEDVATKLETLPSFPLELLAVPEGLRRVPHPLEAMVAFAEDEAARALATRKADGK